MVPGRPQRHSAYSSLRSGPFCIADGGEVLGLQIADYVPKSYRKASKIMARDIVLAVAAAHQAVSDAGLRTRCLLDRGDVQGEPNFDPARFGANIGAGLICADLHELAEALHSASESGVFDIRKWGPGMNNLTPLWLLKFLPNMLACHVTIVHDAEGPSNTLDLRRGQQLPSDRRGCRGIARRGRRAHWWRAGKANPMAPAPVAGWAAQSPQRRPRALPALSPARWHGGSGAAAWSSSATGARGNAARGYAEPKFRRANDVFRRPAGALAQRPRLALAQGLTTPARPDQGTVTASGYGIPHQDSRSRGHPQVLTARRRRAGHEHQGRAG